MRRVQILLIKRHHAPSDRHVHGNLSRHAADQNHLLLGVGMKGRVENIFGPPQFVFRQTRRDDAFPARSRTCEQTSSQSPSLFLRNCFTCSRWWSNVHVRVVRWSGGCSSGLWRWRNVWLDQQMCSGPTGAPWCLWRLIARLPYLSTERNGKKMKGVSECRASLQYKGLLFGGKKSEK